MPVLETTDKVAPRSVIRHRPIHGGDERDALLVTPVAWRAHRPLPGMVQTADDEEASSAPAAVPTSQPSAGKGKGSSATPLRTAQTRQQARRGRAHPLLYLGLGMLLMLALWVGLTQTLTWATNAVNTVKYGYPRTYQVDAFVGHNESAGTPSHFLAINLHGRIEVIELPGGDATHARIYVGPQLYGPGSDLVPVTLQFADVTGDHKPDMILSVQGTRIVYLNDQGGFRPLKPDEQRPVQQWLKRHRE